MAAPQKALTLQLKVTKLPSNELALTNKVYLNPVDAKAFRAACSDFGFLIKIKDFVFTFDEDNGIKPGFIGFSSVHRRVVELSLGEPLDVTPYIPTSENIYMAKLNVELDFLNQNAKVNDEFKTEDINKVLIREFANQFFIVNQKFVTEVNGVNLEARVKSIEVVNLISIAKQDEHPTATSSDRGILHNNTVIVVEKAPKSAIRIVGGEINAPSIFRPDWNFERMGIGGLDKEFSDIFRRAFASRIFPPSIVQKLGISHVKGILLYGPPGTGKTLIARQIGKMLNGKEPKIVNGPEILNKYVGQSEENIRNLFKDAEIEYKERGEASELHIIIFDEIDAICKQRGSRNDGTGVGDTVVNQLLSKIDGVEALNNILVIGMTNRKDLIDEALLRPGRLEVHMEIGLPDQKGRVQIFKIHTKKMRDNGYMGDDVDLEELAAETKNFSGAEIEGLVKSATSFAFNRQVDVANGLKVKEGQIKVQRQDFLNALREIKPAFGVDNDDFENCMRNGIIQFGPKVDHLIGTGKLFVQQVRNSDRTPLVSVLIEGPPGSGKTAIAAKLATESGYPYVKLISPEQLVGYSEVGKCSRITKTFEDAYKSPLSCIVIDNMERLLDYVRIGPRFSNLVLQTLLVFLKREPSKGRRLLIFATTSNKRVLEDMEFMECFNAVLNVPQITTAEEFKKVLRELKTFSSEEALDQVARSFSGHISVKKLIMIAEMAKQGESETMSERFISILQESALNDVQGSL